MMSRRDVLQHSPEGRFQALRHCGESVAICARQINKIVPNEFRFASRNSFLATPKRTRETYEQFSLTQVEPRGQRPISEFTATDIAMGGRNQRQPSIALSSKIYPALDLCCCFVWR
jgi:hypothetical protein